MYISILMGGSIGIIFCISAYQRICFVNDEIQKFESEMLTVSRQDLKNIVNTTCMVLEKINSQHSKQNQKLSNHDMLQSLIAIPYGLIDHVYQTVQKQKQNPEKTIQDQTVKKRVLSTLKSLTYNAHGYFWVMDTHMKMLLEPKFPELTNKNMANYSINDKILYAEGTRTSVFQEIVKLAKENPEGAILQYKWHDMSDTSKLSSRIAWVRLFKPWNWIIGTSITPSSSTHKAMTIAKEMVRTMIFGEDKYVWIMTPKHDMMVHTGLPELEGQNVSQYEVDDKPIVARGEKTPLFLKMSSLVNVNPEGTFIEYDWIQPNSKVPHEQISYIQLFKPWNWIIGADISLEKMNQHILTKKESMKSSLRIGLIITFLIAISFFILSLVLIIVYFNVILKDLRNTKSDLVAILRQGDLKRRLGFDERKDELGSFAELFNKGLDDVYKTMKGFFDTVETLSHLSHEIEASAKEMSTRLFEISTQSQATESDAELVASHISGVASITQDVTNHILQLADASKVSSNSIKESGSATKEIAQSLNAVAGDAEEMSCSVNTVATAIEEMYSSLNEVARNAGRGANVTREASDKADQTSQMMNVLGDAAKEIGDVVNLIKDIAAQTNLLALNATIEAAGAGEAGKGFAVVANEVKELARQTAGATEDIREKVGSMQNNTVASIKAIEVIVTVISEINSIMTTIASAVEQQTATTNEIAKNVAEAANSAKSVSLHLRDEARIAGETAEKVADVIDNEEEISSNINNISKRMAGISKEVINAANHTDSVLDTIKKMTSSINSTGDFSSKAHKAVEELTLLSQKLNQSLSMFQL